MPSRYEPRDHIQRLDVAPRTEGILDQREITIQSYQTTVPFDYAALDAGLGHAWLTPQIRFGVFARSALGGDDALHVILGLQDQLSVRAYDYDARRPLWFTWQDVIVDTVGIRYFRDEEGLLRFTTSGGGRRITDERLHDFNAAFLRIAKEAVTKRQFDLAKLRELCFERFVERLYMLRFSDPSGEEYKSIDHALFQSRLYIDPAAKRLHEVREDPQVKVESFDSDILVRGEDLAEAIQVRFFIRGLSGSLRLRFPKINYKSQLETPEEQAGVFYRLVDVTVSSILDADYYTHQRRSLDELEKLDPNLALFPDLVDITPFREVLISEEARRDFLAAIDVSAAWSQWLPHLRAIDELLVSDVIRVHVVDVVGERARRDPGQVVRLLAACQTDAKLHRVGAAVAGALAAELQVIPAEMRAHAEEALLAWAINGERDRLDIDSETGEVTALTLRWHLDDLAIDILPAVIWKLVGVVHARLAEGGDAAALLPKFAWCITVAKALPPHHSKSPAALRLVAAGRVPVSIADARRVLKEPVADLRALDEAVLGQFGLPLWPLLSAARTDGKIVLTNAGIGSALAVTARPVGMLFAGDGVSPPMDILAGASVAVALPGNLEAVDVTFEKLGARHRVSLPVVGEAADVDVQDNVRVLPAITRKRRAAQLEFRKSIDPQGVVVGSSPALLEVFEHIQHANQMGDTTAVLILGERGTGKTHIAKLLHESSKRAAHPFKETNAGGGGGDLNIQRGEWIGYGKNHGIQGIDRSGRSGHLMHAHRGTLFIDEFATLSQDLQVIFLSVLEGRAIEKVGGESVTSDVRCIFATNADVDEAVANGTLRADLLDRIPVRIRIPSLRERRCDVLLLAKHFAGEHAVSDKCHIALLRYDWPGNIRELKNKVDAAVARKKSDGSGAVDLAHVELPPEIVSAVEAIDEEAGRRELWTLADEIARGEGLGRGDGLQKRAGEILGVGEAQASKMYRAFGLAGATPSRGTAGTA